MPEQLRKAKKIKKRYESEWLRKEGILAVGIGKVDKSVGIIVSVDSKCFTEHISIPSDIEGVQIKIQDIGTLRAF